MDTIIRSKFLKDFELKTMSNKIKFIKNISWLLFEHGIRIGGSIVTASILARVLGIEKYGIFQYLLGLVVIFKSLSYLNPAEIMVPRLTNVDAMQRRYLMGSGFFIRVFFCIVAYIAFLAFVYFSDVKAFNLALILGFCIFLDEAFGIVTAFLQSQTMIKYRSVLYICFAIIKITILASLFWLGVTNIYIYALTYMLESICMALGLLWVYKVLNKELFFTFDFNKILPLLKDGLPFFLGICFMCIFLRADIVATRYLSDGMTLGLYASAIQLFGSVTAIAPIIAVSFAPLFVYKFDELYTIKKNIWLLACGMITIALFTSMAMYFLSPILISLIFGAKFNDAVEIFRYLLFILPLIFLNEALNLYIIKMKLGKLLIYKWGLALGGAVVAYLYFVPIYGAAGTVVGLGIGYFVVCILGAAIILNDKGDL
jgi:putative lipopolysaccharide o-antigen export integral membrane protein